MTIDQRLEFLLQSTESLHASVHELSATVHELSTTVQKMVAGSEADGANIRALAQIAEIHERRISNLEGNTDPSSNN